MKFAQSLIAVAAGLVIAGSAFAENLTSSVANSNGVVSSSGAAASVVGTGSSVSRAGNFQVAASAATANRSVGDGTVFFVIPTRSGHADAAGVAAVAGGSYASNVSTGGGVGEAGAGGASVINLGASASYDRHNTLPEGSVVGGASAINESSVRVGTDGSAYYLGGAVSGFVGTSDAIKVGNSDSLLFNGAVTTAQAGAVGGETFGSQGTGQVQFHQNAASAYVNSNAASGNAVSND